jgi:hypothetical protein
MDIYQASISAATRQLAKTIHMADRIYVDRASGVYQFRIPENCTGFDPTCYDSQANYRWEQFKLNNGRLLFYDRRGCGRPSELLSRYVAGFTMDFRDQASPPPGGDPAVQDNNLVTYTLDFDDANPVPPPWQHQRTGAAASRAVPYSNVLTSGGQDSGSGLTTDSMRRPNPC